MPEVVGISEMKTTKDAQATLVTYSLGSCVGVTIYDPEAKVGGMIHCMLPLSSADKDKAQRNPAMFVDSGVAMLLTELIKLGAQKKRLVIKVAGGASPLDNCGRFKIGERNYTVLRKILWKNDLLIKAEDVGGTLPRTLTLYMSDGRTTIKTAGKETEL